MSIEAHPLFGGGEPPAEGAGAILVGGVVFFPDFVEDRLEAGAYGVDALLRECRETAEVFNLRRAEEFQLLRGHGERLVVALLLEEVVVENVHRVEGRAPYLLREDRSAGVLVVEGSEEQSFREGPGERGRVVPVDGRSEDEDVRRQRLLKDGPKVVAQGAESVALATLDLAGEAPLAAREGECAEVDGLRFAASLLEKILDTYFYKCR